MTDPAATGGAVRAVGKGGVVASSQRENVAPEAALPVKSVAAGGPQEREPDPALSRGTDGDGTARIFDRNELLDRLGGAEEALDSIVSLFLLSVSEHIVALLQAFSEGDTREIRFHAHTVAGIAANVSAPRISSTAARLEALAKGGSLVEVPDLLAELQESLLAFQSLLDASAKEEA